MTLVCEVDMCYEHKHRQKAIEAIEKLQEAINGLKEQIKGLE